MWKDWKRLQGQVRLSHTLLKSATSKLLAVDRFTELSSKGKWEGHVSVSTTSRCVEWPSLHHRKYNILSKVALIPADHLSDFLLCMYLCGIWPY